MINRSINITGCRLLTLHLQHFQPIKTTVHKAGVKSVAIIVSLTDTETVTAAIAVLLFDPNKSRIFCMPLQSRMLYCYSYCDGRRYSRWSSSGKSL